ncbi:hypothetical protein WAI453_002198 [Rhynchosporium graminicola]
MPSQSTYLPTINADFSIYLVYGSFPHKVPNGVLAWDCKAESQELQTQFPFVHITRPTGFPCCVSQFQSRIVPEIVPKSRYREPADQGNDSESSNGAPKAVNTPALPQQRRSSPGAKGSQVPPSLYNTGYVKGRGIVSNRVSPLIQLCLETTYKLRFFSSS